MAVIITARTNTKDLARIFSPLGADNCRRAMANVLNTLAASSRKEVLRTVPDYMMVRDKGFTARSVRFWKTDRRKLRSEAGTTDPRMVDQHEGGERRDTKQPMVGQGRPRSAWQKRVPPSKAFSVIRQRTKRRTWFGPTPHGMVGLWQEVGPKTKPGKRLLYVLHDMQRVKAQWPMNAIIKRQSEARLPRAVAETWEKWTKGIPFKQPLGGS